MAEYYRCLLCDVLHRKDHGMQGICSLRVASNGRREMTVLTSMTKGAAVAVNGEWTRYSGRERLPCLPIRFVIAMSSAVGRLGSHWPLRSLTQKRLQSADMVLSIPSAVLVDGFRLSAIACRWWRSPPCGDRYSCQATARTCTRYRHCFRCESSCVEHVTR